MRVMLFFDGKNFFSGWSRSEQPRLDYRKLSAWLTRWVHGDTFVGAHYYTGVEVGRNELPETQGNLTRFLKQIEKKRGFFIHRYPRKLSYSRCNNCDSEARFTQEKRVDTALVADMVRLAAVDAYDIAVLLSGDEDFVPAIEAVSHFGKQVWVASWKGSGLSEHLEPVAFDLIDLTKGLENFKHVMAPAPTPTVSTLPDGEEPINSLVEYPEENPEHQSYLQALDRAEEHFRRSRAGGGGFVGLGYYMTKWDDVDLPDGEVERREILDHLVEKGRITVYDSGTGYKAIEINQDWAPPEIVLAQAVEGEDDDDDIPLNDADELFDEDGAPITSEEEEAVV